MCAAALAKMYRPTAVSTAIQECLPECVSDDELVTWHKKKCELLQQAIHLVFQFDRLLFESIRSVNVSDKRTSCATVLHSEVVDAQLVKISNSFSCAVLFMALVAPPGGQHGESDTGAAPVVLSVSGGSSAYLTESYAQGIESNISDSKVYSYFFKIYSSYGLMLMFIFLQCVKSFVCPPRSSWVGSRPEGEKSAFLSLRSTTLSFGESAGTGASSGCFGPGVCAWKCSGACYSDLPSTQSRMLEALNTPLPIGADTANMSSSVKHGQHALARVCSTDAVTPTATMGKGANFHWSHIHKLLSNIPPNQQMKACTGDVVSIIAGNKCLSAFNVTTAFQDADLNKTVGNVRYFALPVYSFELDNAVNVSESSTFPDLLHSSLASRHSIPFHTNARSNSPGVFADSVHTPFESAGEKTLNTVLLLATYTECSMVDGEGSVGFSAAKELEQVPISLLVGVRITYWCVNVFR